MANRGLVARGEIVRLAGLMLKARRGRVTPYLFILPAIIFMGAFMLHPLLYSLHLSFFEWNMVKPALGKVFVGLGNYVKLLGMEQVRHSLWVTIIFVAVSVTLELLLGFAVALLLNREFVGVRIVRALMVTPLMIAPLAAGAVWLIILNPSFGVGNYLLSLIGISPQAWLGDVRLALLSVIAVDVWKVTPFVTIVLLAGLQSLPIELYEATKIDGASGLQSFRYITVPLLKPVIEIVFLLRLMDALKVFDTVFILTRGGPGTATEVFNYYIYRYTFKWFEMGFGSAASYIVFIIAMMITLLYVRTLGRETTM